MNWHCRWCRLILPEYLAYWHLRRGCVAHAEHEAHKKEFEDAKAGH